MAVVN